MPYEVLKYPASVYPGEVDDECPEARPLLDVLFRAMQVQGPSPSGYTVKNLGGSKDHLWQINLKSGGRQVRVLYAPYKGKVVLFRIHKKSSAAEQTGISFGANRFFCGAPLRTDDHIAFLERFERHLGS